MTYEEKKDWAKDYYRFLEKYMCINLATLPDEYIPKLFIDLDKSESYADMKKKEIHIGIKDLVNKEDETEEDLMSSVLFLLGHEIQHVLSTTEKAWMWGIEGGTKKICEALAKKLGLKIRFLSEKDFQKFEQEVSKRGFKISVKAIQHFAHYIANSLEDGRIERIRCILRPGFRNHMVKYRAKEWEENPVSEEMVENIDDPRTFLLLILNEVLSLATMSVFQKGFSVLYQQDKKVFEYMQELIPHIKDAVNSGLCRGCMKQSIDICEILAEEILEACKLTPLEELLQQLMEQMSQNSEYNQNSRNEVSAEGEGIPIFGISDMDQKEESEKNGSEGSKKESKGGSEKKEAKGSGKESKEEAEKADSKNGSEKESEKGASEKGSEKEEKEDSEKESSLEKKIKEAKEKAEEESYGEISNALKGKEQKEKGEPYEQDREDVLPNLSDVAAKYDNVVFEEIKDSFKVAEKMPFDLAGEANVFSRRIQRIFNNRQKPVVRGQKKGRLDAGMVYKLAINEMDLFSKKATVNEFDGCAYLLMDNSGSMGGSYSGSKKYYCTRALAIIEQAFKKHIPVKIVAFDAGWNNVCHMVIKNWHQSHRENASYNFLVNGNCYYGGNMDGYSIRVATKELLAQPEKKKLLFVLSDGLPSAYKSERSGCEDVKDAVKAARKAGVEVVSILFEQDIKENSPSAIVFKDMYEKNCIITEPQNISNEVLRILKKFCFR